MERAIYRGLLLFGATLLAVWAILQILAPFVGPIAWALCLAAVTAKPYAWLAGRLGRPRLASGLMVLLTALVILAPLILVGFLVVGEAETMNFEPAKKALADSELVNWINARLRDLGLGDLNALLDRIQGSLPEIAQRIFSRGVAEGAISVLVAPFVFVFGLLIALFTLYFVYCEAPRLRSLVVDLSPLDETDTLQILSTLRDTTTAAIFGGVLVAIIQGALGGVAFVIAGIQSPVLWSVVMMAFSLLPFGGTALVWVPAGVYLLLTGETAGGWFILVWGTVIVAMSDNFLRPVVLSRTGARDIHPMLLFFAIISGIGLFGVSGIVFGPLLLAFLTTVVRIYRQHRGGESEAEMTQAEAPSG